MSDAAHAAHQLDHLSVRIPIAVDAAVIEFTKPRLPAVANSTSAAIPAYTVTARVLHLDHGTCDRAHDSARRDDRQ